MSAAAGQVHLLFGAGAVADPAAVVDAWANSMDSPRTAATYKRSAALALKTMGRVDPRRVSAQEVAAFKSGQAGRAPATVALRLTALRSLFRYLIATGEVASDPTAAIPIPRVHPTAPRALSLDQARRIAAEIDTTTVGGMRDAATVALLFSGLRVAEVAGLNVGDVRLMDQDGHTFVRVSVIGKGAKPRDVDLPRRIHDLVTRYLEARGGPREPAMPLFLASVSGYRNQPGRMTADRIYRQLRRYARRANVPITGSHVGRHTWARLAEANGAQMVDIMGHLGHANLNVTATYLRRLAGKRNPAHSHVPDVV